MDVWLLPTLTLEQMLDDPNVPENIAFEVNQELCKRWEAERDLFE